MVLYYKYIALYRFLQGKILYSHMISVIFEPEI